MILPNSPSNFPVRGPHELEGRAVIGTPFEMLVSDLTLFAGISIPVSNVLAMYNEIVNAPAQVNILENPGLSYLDLCLFSKTAPAGINKVKAYGWIKVPGGASESPHSPQYVPGVLNMPDVSLVGGGIIVPLFVPDTGAFEVEFSATPEIEDSGSFSGKGYTTTSSNAYVYCPGVNKVFVITSGGTGLDTGGGKIAIMGRFVG